MEDAPIISRDIVYEAGGEKLSLAETDLKNTIDSVTDPTKQLDQRAMLNLQFQMQSFTLFVQTIASIQKEFSDMLKAIVAKF